MHFLSGVGKFTILAIARDILADVAFGFKAVLARPPDTEFEQRLLDRDLPSSLRCRLRVCYGDRAGIFVSFAISRSSARVNGGLGRTRRGGRSFPRLPLQNPADLGEDTRQANAVGRAVWKGL